MKWFANNPVGAAFAAVSGVFVLIMLVIAIVWNLPVSVDNAETSLEVAPSDDAVLNAQQISPMKDLLVINERPVFNESRLPVIETEEDIESEEDATIEVKDAPDVRLTGVIITPRMKIASLTPAKENQESVMAHEGEALTGEFVGWQVSSVSPRLVVLESRDGQTLELDLQVHDVTIKEPPKPAKATATAAAKDEPQNPAQATLNEDGEPMSRAEQIRQRIAERREELRLEQEAQQAQQNASTPTAANQPGKRSNYQQAIRNMMNNKPKEPGTNDDKDG